MWPLVVTWHYGVLRECDAIYEVDQQRASSNIQKEDDMYYLCLEECSMLG